MSKKKLAVAAIVIAATVFMVVPVGVSRASGSAEASGGVSGRTEGTVLGADTEAAVDLATRIPEQWDYDPSDRVVHPEDAELDYPIEIPDPAWRELLTPTEFAILRQKGTERAFTHPLNDESRKGIYYSAATGQPLFSSEDKYDSRSGWPSFTRPINPHAIVYVEDNSLFAMRIEVVDSLSGSHLGHVFNDGPAPTGQRYCINGAALVFVPEGEAPPEIRTAAP